MIEIESHLGDNYDTSTIQIFVVLQPFHDSRFKAQAAREAQVSILGFRIVKVRLIS